MKYLRVVIFDDEPWILSLIKKLIPWDALKLRLVGEARDGVEGLHVCITCKPNIIITDIRMPGMNGLDLVRDLRRNNSTSEIIIVSGYDEFEYAKQAIEYGVSGYVVKPIKRNELTDLLVRARSRILERVTETRELADLRQSIKKIDALVNRREEETDPEVEVSDERVKRAIEYIEKHYNEGISLRDVADAVFLQSNYFSNLFKSKVGVGFAEYLCNLRMEKARGLLQHRILRVAEIARLIGYRDPNYFSRTFKKRTGFSPGQYRAEKLSNT